MSEQITTEVEKWMEELQREDAAMERAIGEGITRVGDPVTPLERYGIEAIVDHAADFLRHRDDVPVEAVEDFVTEFANTVAQDQLLRKLLGAWMIEHTVADAGLPDGIVGQAVDQAIEAVTPYAKRHRLWWQSVMED